MGLFSRKKEQAPTTIEGSNELKPISGFVDDDIDALALLTVLFQNQLGNVDSEAAKQTSDFLAEAEKHFRSGVLSEFDLSLMRYYYHNLDPEIFERSLRKKYFALMKKLDRLKL